jgi:hypothetical protein
MTQAMKKQVGFIRLWAVKIAYLQRICMSYCIMLILILTLSAAPTRATETEPSHADPDTDQSDIYYDAMLRSIELDTNRWKSFSRSMESGPWYYDTQSLKRNGKKVTALVTVFPHPNRTDIYRSVYGEHTKIRKIEFVTEINCAKQTYRQPQIRVYGYFRELLAEHSFNGKEQNYSPIKLGTTTDTLRILVCGPDKKKRHN